MYCHLKKVCDLQVGVVATPDLHSFDLTEREHFIILGCDGLWGVCFLLLAVLVLNIYQSFTITIKLHHGTVSGFWT